MAGIILRLEPRRYVNREPVSASLGVRNARLTVDRRSENGQNGRNTFIVYISTFRQLLLS